MTRHSGEIPDVRDWLCRIEDAAGSGYHVEREPDLPYGWNLIDPHGAVICSGTLDRLEQWVVRRNTDPDQ
ncbi:hypothetical protein GZH49_37525 [Nocardia terpenica]|uniref:hypothetical protein n=1 Tax=Nocardia terpenica TaxID=455432 RepID=UPI002FE16561